MRRTNNLAFSGLFSHFVRETFVLSGVAIATPFALAASAAIHAKTEPQTRQRRTHNTSPTSYDAPRNYPTSIVASPVSATKEDTGISNAAIELGLASPRPRP